MEAIDRNKRSLEEVVVSLLNEADLSLIADEAYKAEVQIQKIKGEMRKYLNRPRKWITQIEYLKNQIREIERNYPQMKKTFS